jgi:hypothetical protein
MLGVVQGGLGHTPIFFYHRWSGPGLRSDFLAVSRGRWSGLGFPLDFLFAASSVVDLLCPHARLQA